MSLGSLAHSQLAGFKSGSPHPGPRFCSWCPNTTSSGLPTPHSWGSTGSVPIGGTRGACHWGIAIHQVQCYQRPNVMRWAVRLGFPKNGLCRSMAATYNSEWLADGGWIVEPQTEEHHIPSKRTRVGLPSGNRSLPNMIILGGSLRLVPESQHTVSWISFLT